MHFDRYVVVAVTFASLLVHGGAFGQPLTITTLAGRATGGNEDGTAGVARFSAPYGIAADRSGNLYIADTGNHTIRKISANGRVTTLAGLSGHAGSADGSSSTARFNSPAGLTVDRDGNVYVADSANHTIRKVTSVGVVTTFAGQAGGRGSTDGTRAARFNNPWAVAADAGGNIFVADTANDTIRRIAADGTVTTLAGVAGSYGIADGVGSAARFNGPSGIAIDDSRNLFVSDSLNQTIRKITPSGEVTTIAGSAGQMASVDGTGSAARFAIPRGIAIDGSGNLYVAEEETNTLRKIAPDGVVTTVAGLARMRGSDDGIGTAARLAWPVGVATDDSGNVYVADVANSAIRKVTAAGIVTTVAGFGGSLGNADGSGDAARFALPSGVAVDSSDNVFVSDAGNAVIRKISPSGEVTRFCGATGKPGSSDGIDADARFSNPANLTIDLNGNLYVADSDNFIIRRVTPGRVVTTLAGSAGNYGSADGTGPAAQFGTLGGIAADPSGNIYVADRGNNALRKITPAGVVTTIGNGFDGPQGVAVDTQGNVYVADTRNYVIRKVAPNGVVTTIAGSAQSKGSADGSGAAARFSSPTNLAFDDSGNLYVTDAAECFFLAGCSGGNTIRKITPDGVVTTVAGLPGIGGSADGTGSAARFNVPSAVALDRHGTLYIVEQNNVVRTGRASLTDAATIDSSTGPVGLTRLLGSTPQTATSWTWSIIRQPADSTSTLSSTTVRNPTFTPDVPGLFTFRLVASGTSSTSITTVDLMSSSQRRRAAVH